MKEKLRGHLDLLFENAPKTRRALELKEELYANSAERYDDLTNNGITAEDAYKNVVNSIGNVSELFRGLEEMSSEEIKVEEEKVKKAAMIKTAAVGIYIFSIVVFLSCIFMVFPILSYANAPSVGIIAMLLIDIVPTCMLVYAANAYPNYKRLDHTVVEEFKAWKSESQRTKSLKAIINVVIWTTVLILYFTISFTTYAWYISWIVFLVGACASAVTELLFRLKEMK
jgi:hypothetical protein